MTVGAFFRGLKEYLAGGRLRLILLLLLLLLAAFTLYLDITIRAQFEGKRWALPARVYARPLELYPGAKLTPEQLAAELALLRYHQVAAPEEPGSYRRAGEEFELLTRPFLFWDGTQNVLRLRVELDGGRVHKLRDHKTGATVNLARLDPLLIGSIYPAHNEDRVLVRLKEVPQDIVNGLVAVEDRKFFSHHGVDPRGMARAAVTMLRGGAVQGGSTLTQQLVKNFYLSSDRTLRRKFTEILMALLLESHYGKEEILETYVNEIYLGQDGNRAVHGFGLASHFYFGQPLPRLTLAQSALLVALVKGPSHYDPRRFPQRALERRNLVLAELHRREFISPRQLAAARAEPLGVTTRPPSGASPYPAFLDLVHRQLRRDYDEDDLRSEGLQIFTTLDPQAQRAAEYALTRRLAELERARGMPAHTLEGSVVVTSAQHGEVQAVVGGRDTLFEGFNRALDAQRPIGSLIKPAVYLAALERPDSYTLATPLDDSRLVWKERGIKDWEPNNYDMEFHGRVALHTALANSYNVATARLGLELGVPKVMETVQRLGVEREFPTYASSLLGTSELAPIEVAQMYQTLASGGFRSPLRAIREILTVDGKPLQRYPLAVEQAVEPAPAYLLTTALQGVVREGTGQGLKQYVAPAVGVAGKTGTTGDLRDSWFAGYTGDRLAVVWVGADDNRPVQLTGSTGALVVWGDMMAQLDPEPLALPPPETIERVWIDTKTGRRAAKGCQGAVELPFIRGSAPQETAPCAAGAPVRSWFKGLFGE